MKSLLEKEAPGITHLLMSTSLKYTPFAALSRPISGVRGKSIILTLPGSPKACKENIECVLDILPHAVELTRGGSGSGLHTKLQQSTEESDKSHHHHHHHHPKAHTCTHKSDEVVRNNIIGNLSNPLDAPGRFFSRHPVY